MTLSNSSGLAKDNLLKKLSVWATKQELLDDPYVINLIKDITEDRNLNFWAEQDPLNLIPPIESKRGTGLIKLAKFFALFRNVLVFLPVALTWKSVSDATKGFAQFIAQNDATPVNFLEFWQDGYGYISPFWTISNVALIDFWIIMAVVIISLLTNSFVNNGQRILDLSSQELEKEKLAIVLEIKKYLFSAKPHHIETINQDVVNSIEKLNQGMREFNKTSASIEALADYLNKAIPQVQLVHENLNQTSVTNNLEIERVFLNFSQELTQSLKELNTWVFESQESVKKMHEAMQDSLTQYMDNTNEQISRINENMNNVSTANSYELERVFSKFNLDLANDFKELKTFVTELQTSVKKVNKLLDTVMSNSVSNMTSDIDNANKYITKSARKLESELDDLSSQINITTASLRENNEN